MSLQLLSDDGFLVRRDVTELLQQNAYTFATSAAAPRRVSPWNAMPPLQVYNGGDEPTDCRRFVQNFFAEVADRSPVAPIERMLRGAQVEPAVQQQQQQQQRPGVRGYVDANPFLGTLLTSSETLATLAIVDASCCNNGNKGSSASSSQAASGVSVCPAHVLHTYMDTYVADIPQVFAGSPLAAHNAATSPRRRGVQTPSQSLGASGPGTDVVLAFQISSLSQKVVTVMAPVVGHWVIVGTFEQCKQALVTLSRSISALRTADCPVCCPAATCVSLLVTEGVAARGDDSSLAALSSAISASSPVVLYLAAPAAPADTPGRLSRPASRAAGAESSESNRALLEAIRGVAHRTKALRLQWRAAVEGADSSACATPFLAVAAYLQLACAASTGHSTKVAFEVLSQMSLQTSKAFYEHVLAESLQLLASSASLSEPFSSLRQVDHILRKATRVFFRDLCGGYAPALASLIEQLDTEMSRHSHVVMNDLRVEAFHMAQSLAAAAVRPLSQRLVEVEVRSSKPSDALTPLEWSHRFAETVALYLRAPLLRTDPLSAAPPQGVAEDDENLVTRTWASSAKRSAMMDIVVQWFLPNSEVLLQSSSEHERLRDHNKNEMVRDAQLQLAELESRLHAQSREREKLSQQMEVMHKAADDLQDAQNKVQALLLSSYTAAAQTLKGIRQERAKAKFIEQNSDGVHGSDDAVAVDAEDQEREHRYLLDTQGLESAVVRMLSDTLQTLQLLGHPTHGLLVIDGVHTLHGANHAMATPNTSIIDASRGRGGNRSLDVSRQSNRAVGGTSGAVKSPGRGLDVQAARRAAEKERAAEIAATSLPPSPISPTIAPPSNSAFTRGWELVAQGAAPSADELSQQEAKVHASMAAVAELQQRAAGLRDQLASLQRHTHDVESRLRDAVLQLSSAKEDTARLAERCSDIEERYAGVANELQSERASHHQTRCELQQAQDDLRHTTGLLDASRIACAELDKTVQLLQSAEATSRHDFTVRVETLSSSLRETTRKLELTSVESAMHESNAKQFSNQVQQLETVLQQERHDKRESHARYEQRLQELLNKLDETVRHYSDELQRSSADLKHQIGELRSSNDSLMSERGSLRQEVEHLSRTLDEYKRKTEELTSRHESQSAENSRCATALESCKEQLRVMEIKYSVAQEEARSSEYQMSQLREELRQSREARRALCHSMDALEMFIQEQRTLSDGGAVADALSTSTVHMLEHNIAPPPLPSAMSVIRAVAAESISRDEQLGTPAFHPLERSAAHNVSTASSHAPPISLHDLLGAQSAHAEVEPMKMPLQSSFVPVYVPPARQHGSGPRPLGPHLKALSAIDAMLHGS